jgi:protein TonB
VVKQKPVPPPPAPQPVASPNLPPAPNAPTGVTEPQPAPPPINTPVAAVPAPAPPPAPAPAKVELPSSDADYLQNPHPAYPPASKRMGEQGKVIVRVLIGVDGTAKDAELKQSSGFDRLDRAALDTVRKWRYVPGKRGGVAEAMWFNVPINFVLE